VSQSAFVKGPTSELIWVVFGEAAGPAGDGQRSVVYRDRDTIECIADFPTTLTLCYYVVVAYKGCCFDLRMPDRLCLKIIETDMYTLGVYHDFMPLAWCGVGAFSFSATSPRLINAIFTSPDIGRGSPSLRPDQILSIIERTTVKLTAMTLEVIIDDIPNEIKNVVFGLCLMRVSVTFDIEQVEDFSDEFARHRVIFLPSVN
jgi:hypothetical protein